MEVSTAFRTVVGDTSSRPAHRKSLEETAREQNVIVGKLITNSATIAEELRLNTEGQTGPIE